MRNVTGKLMNAWYELLSGNISVPVYRVDAPPTEEGNYVLLRAESETDDTNNHSFVTNPVIITEVITKFQARIDDGLAGEIDDEIAQLIQPTPGTHALPVQDDIQVVDVRRSSATYINEDDGTFRYHRLVTRNLHRVVQLVNQS